MVGVVADRRRQLEAGLRGDQFADRAFLIGADLEDQVRKVPGALVVDAVARPAGMRVAVAVEDRERVAVLEDPDTVIERLASRVNGMRRGRRVLTVG